LPGGENGETLRDLVVRLIDSAKDYLRAEMTVAKRTALEWAARAKPAIVFVIIAILLLQAGLTVLLAALGLTLAHWIGTAGGMAVAGVLALALAGLLAWLAVSRITGKGR